MNKLASAQRNQYNYKTRKKQTFIKASNVDREQLTIICREPKIMVTILITFKCFSDLNLSGF